MAKLKLPKLKFNINLPVLLWVVFLAVVIIEALVLYQGLRPTVSSSDETVVVEQTVKKVDFPAYEKSLKWIEDRESFAIPGYSLQSGTTGRENPFFE